LQCATDARGYKRVLAFANCYSSTRRVWAIEGMRSYGYGLTTFLLERGEWVVEIDRLAKPASRNGAKSDELDAVRAAREALSREYLAAPRARGGREAMRVLITARRGAVSRAPKPSVNSRPSSSTPPKACASSCVAAPPTNSSTGAPACGLCPVTRLNTGQPFELSAPSPQSAHARRRSGRV
jgi:hypothetical protein